MKRALPYKSLALLLALCLSLPLCAPVSAAAESAASTVPELIAQIRNHTQRAEDPFSIRATGEMVDRVIRDDGGLLSAVMFLNGVYTAEYEYGVFGEERTVTFANLVYYPGQKIEAALRTGDASRLTARERETMRAAQRVAAAVDGSELEREKAVHDYLCDTVAYETKGTYLEENDTAVGALLNGRADCDGFTDAFSLLCFLAGLDTRRVTGQCFTDGIAGGHAWNAVKINGQWCFVDVTNDNQPSEKMIYVFYNRGTEELRSTHAWRAEALDIPVVAAAGNSLRNPELAENAVGSWEEFAAVVYAEAAGKPRRIGITCSAAFSLDADPERFAAIIYTSGITGLTYGQTGGMIELTDLTYYEHFRRVSTEEEAAAFLEECRNENWADFTLICPDSLFQTLMQNSAEKMFRMLSDAGYSKRELYFNEAYGHIIIENAQ